ncbi:FAD-dependent oxidoreductase [Microbulbifer sp. SAOS-129_SWC]|uniref:FAD-dependent oxidoreductase n=1 Tax=Microbulbifer sp. SAOS-129_SWC TaxID=3145235 RepID=UPI003216CBEB
MPHFTSSQLAEFKNLPNTVETLVVGAGMAGLYCAWRLQQSDPGSSVIVVDRSGRTGGRLDSDLVHFADGETVKEEEGGMRFTFEDMDDLMSLFLLLDLDDQIVPFPMSSGGNNRLCYRGHSFTNQFARENNYSIWSQLYDLRPEEQGIDPKSILDTTFNRILAENPDFKERPDQRTPEFWQKFRLDCQWQGVPLKDWTLWNLFSDMGYSKECIELLYNLLGFNGTILSQMNAGIAFQLLEDFPDNPQFHTLENGFSTLPNALVEKIGKERIFLETGVIGIEGTEQDEYYTAKTIGPDGELGEIQAKKIILALPRLPLEKLFAASPAVYALPKERSETLWNTLQTTTNQPLVKINLYYEQAWWGTNLTGREPVAFGPNFSDLPLGSVYPFYAIDAPTFAALEYEELMKELGRDIPPETQARVDQINQKKYKLPAALTIYCDFMNVNFWEALQNNGPLFDSPMQEKYSQKVPQTIFPASQAVVKQATDFFQQLFNTHYVPQPMMTSTRIWSGSTRFNRPASEQFDFAVHQWALGANDSEVMALMAEPLQRIYTCGEAFSDDQGWVEGALRSADLALHKGYQLDPISKVYEQTHGESPSKAIKDRYVAASTVRIQEYIDPNFDPNESEKKPGITTAPGDFALNLSYFDQV